MKILEIIIKAIPYPQQITAIEVEEDKKAVRFTWRGTRYRVGESLFCEEVGDDVLIGTDRAILVSRLLEAIQEFYWGVKGSQWFKPNAHPLQNRAK